METLTIKIDEQVLKKIGEKQIKRYIDRMITIDMLEDFTESFRDQIHITDAEYNQSLEQIRQSAWDKYKKDLPIQ